jgi:choline dehydrogenase-like flavoprotein
MWRGIMQAATVTEFADGGRGRTGYVIESAPGHPGLGGAATAWESGAQFLDRAAALPRLAPFIAIVRDGGAGTVRPTRQGGVRVDYRLDAEGRATVRHALDRMCRLARAAGAEWVTVPSSPERRLEVAGLRDEAAFERFVADLGRLDLGPNRIGLFSAHQMGSARAGVDPRRHACDPGGRVRSGVRGDLVPGLYVGDGSLFPTGLGVNPMLTVMVLARGVARSILADG